MSRSLTLSLLAGAFLLTACGPFPDARLPGFQRPVAPAPVAPGRPASDAEAACFEAARSAGFEGARLAGSAEVMGPQGIAASRDVMIGVRRGGQSFEVRCSYSYATNTARIMTL
jgi:hypothetical protein